MNLCNSSALIHCQVYGRQSAWEGWGPTTPECAKLMRVCGNVKRDYSYGPKERVAAIRAGYEAGQRWRRSQGLGALGAVEPVSTSALVGTALLVTAALTLTAWEKRKRGQQKMWQDAPLMWIGIGSLAAASVIALRGEGG